jgi:hypothetical protein
MSPEVSNEAVKRSIPWLTRDRFPNLWPLDAMAITYLNENKKYACRVRNRDMEVQDVPQDDGQDREVGGNEGNEERAEDDEPNGEKEAQENGHRNQVRSHLHNPG